MSRISAALALAFVLLLGACSDDPLDESGGAVTQRTVDECGSISQPILQVLASRILIGEATLNVNSIPATTVDGAWFVSGEIEGKGHEGSGDIGIWATTTDPESDDASLEFTAVNDLAIGGSNWEEDPELSEDDPAIETLIECVEAGTRPTP